MTALVDVAWLAGRLHAPDLVVLDATLYLPNESGDAGHLYREAHIPGAGFLDFDAFADPEDALPHMLPSAGRFAGLAGALGVRAGVEVVCYDQKGLFSAARAWWMFRVFGHDRVRVLDGGLPAWRRAGQPVESGYSPACADTRFVPALRTRLLCGSGDLAAEADRMTILDARDPARFAGTAPEPRPGMRAGHIPGSRNLPYRDMLAGDGTMRPAAELRASLLAAGADRGQVVASCGSGVTGAILLLAMHEAGLADGALYDGSWAEWGSRPELPVETGHAGDAA